MALSPQALQRYNTSDARMEAFLHNPSVGIDTDALIEHLQAAYDLGGGNNPIGLTGVQSFMDSFNPDDLTKNTTSTFCQQLFGFQTTKFRPLLTRTDDNQKQCRDAGYPNLVNVRCIWCGEPILDFSECEHALPILMAAPLLGFSTARANRREAILEYGYAHRLCNQVKNDLSFLIWNDTLNKWEIDWINMREMYIRISNVGRHNNKSQANFEPHHAAPKALFYTLDLSGSPGLGKAKTVANHDPGYEISIARCNILSREGKHRNLERIKAACNTIGQRIDLLTPQFSSGPVVVQAGGSKKTKKNRKYNKILTQKGGDLVITGTIQPGTIPPNMLQTLGPDLSRIRDVDLARYLSQEIPNSGTIRDVPANWNPIWADNDNHLLYGVARMECIRDHVNSVLGSFRDDLVSFRLYLLLKIIKSPDVKKLAEEATGAPPPPSQRDIFERDKKLLLKKIKKEISAYNTFKIPLFTRMPRNPPANLQQIIDDKKAAYVEIKATERLIKVHNQKVQAAGYEESDEKDLTINLNSDIPYYQNDLQSRLITIKTVWSHIKTGGARNNNSLRDHLSGARGNHGEIWNKRTPRGQLSESKKLRRQQQKLQQQQRKEERKIAREREILGKYILTSDTYTSKPDQDWHNLLSSTASDVEIPTREDIQDLIERRFSEYIIGVNVDDDSGGGGTAGDADDAGDVFEGFDADADGASMVGGSLEDPMKGFGKGGEDMPARQLSDSYGFDEESGGLEESMREGGEGGEDMSVPRQYSGPYGFHEESDGLNVKVCIDVLRPFIQDYIPEDLDGYATNIVTTLMTDLFKKVLLRDASAIIIDLYDFFKSDGRKTRKTFGVELLYQIHTKKTKWIRTFLGIGNLKYLDVKIDWLFNTLSEFVNLPSQFISEININGRERLVHINASPPIEIPIPNFKMLDNQIPKIKSKTRRFVSTLSKPFSRFFTRKINRSGGDDDVSVSTDLPVNRNVHGVNVLRRQLGFVGGSRKKINKNRKNTKKLNKRKN